MIDNAIPRSQPGQRVQFHFGLAHTKLTSALSLHRLTKRNKSHHSCHDPADDLSDWSMRLIGHGMRPELLAGVYASEFEFDRIAIVHWAHVGKSMPRILIPEATDRAWSLHCCGTLNVATAWAGPRSGCSVTSDIQPNTKQDPDPPLSVLRTRIDGGHRCRILSRGPLNAFFARCTGSARGTRVSAGGLKAHGLSVPQHGRHPADVTRATL